MKDLVFRSWGGEAVGWSKWLPAPCKWWADIGYEGRAMLEEGEVVGYGKLQLAYLTDHEIASANGALMSERAMMAAAMC
jgi:hypothetical protein